MPDTPAGWHTISIMRASLVLMCAQAATLCLQRALRWLANPVLGYKRVREL